MVKFQQWMAAVVSVVGLSAPVWLLYHSGDAGFAPVAALFSGWAFTQRRIITGGALDQPSLHKELFVLCFSLVVLCPPIAFVRWINGRSPRIVRRLFAMASLIILVHPLSILTLFTWDIYRYIYHMGFTPKRLTALVVVIAGYLMMAVFAAWVCGLKLRQPNKSVDPFHFSQCGRRVKRGSRSPMGVASSDF